MTAEPINIFSHKQDLAGIAALLRQDLLNVQVTGADEAWERIAIQGPKSWLRKGTLLVFKNVPDYYTGPDWPKQVAGMQGYFSRFPNVPRKPDILRLIGTFRFALAIESDPDLFLQSNDPRLKFLFGVTKYLDGVLFTPSGLWDAAGRALLCADGRSDPEAVLPAIGGSPQRTTASPAESNPRTIEEEVSPPDARPVARRALCLAAVSCRGLLEETDEMSLEEAEVERKRLLTWVGELALEEELEPKELDVLRRPLGALDKQDAVDAGWRLEGLGVLAWALSRFELPPYDQLVDARVLFPAVGCIHLPNAKLLQSAPVLKPQEELKKLQRQCFALHWRLRDFSLTKKSMNFRRFAETSWFGPLDVSSARFCDEDLAIGKIAIGKAPQPEFQKSLSTANERHLAINWLADGGQVYSETDTST